MNHLEIINQTNKEIDNLNIIMEIMEFALKYQGVNNAIMNLIIVDNETIHKINKQYRNIDKPTDVISFALEDSDDFKDIEYRVLGDIYISINKVYEQSIAYNHSFLREFAFLTVHGVLHLLGFDHIKKEDEIEMFKLQELILHEYNIER